jgi:hypothetical protein
MTFEYRGPSRGTLRIYVWANQDGLLFCKWDDIRIVQSRPRIFVGGSPAMSDLNDIQVRALLQLLYRDADVLKRFSKAVFYSGNDWRDRGCPDGQRGKILSRVALPT